MNSITNNLQTTENQKEEQAITRSHHSKEFQIT